MQTWHNFQIMAMAKPKEVVSFFLFLFFFFLEALCHVPKVEKGGDHGQVKLLSTNHQGDHSPSKFVPSPCLPQ
jgi:hypothetical protein